MNVRSVCVLFAVASEVPPAIQFWGGGKETETPPPPTPPRLNSALLYLHLFNPHWKHRGALYATQ